MLTRKMKNMKTLNIDDPDNNKKTVEDELNKTLQLNEQLLNEQMDCEIEYTNLLKQNKKLKKQLLELEKKYNELSDQNNGDHELITKYSTEHIEYESIIQQNTKLEHTIQELNEKINELIDSNDRYENKVIDQHDKIIGLVSDLSTANSEIIEFRLSIKQKETIIQELETYIENQKKINKEPNQNVKKELAEIRSDLRFKNAELKALKKKRLNQEKKNAYAVLKSSTVKHYNNEDLINLQNKYDELLVESEFNLETLEKNARELRGKINILQNNCDKLRSSYDNLSLQHYSTDKENQELLQTIRDMELALEENEGESLLQVQPMGIITSIKDSKPRNRSIVILGDECTQGIGKEICAHLENYQDFCCFTYQAAPIEFLTKTAKNMAEKDENSISAIILLTRKVKIWQAKTYVSELLSLHKILKEKNIKMICANMTYINGQSPSSIQSNDIIYKCNTLLHNHSIYDPTLDIVNLCAVDNKLTSNQFKSLIVNYVRSTQKTTLNSNAFFS